ncbi:MAG: tetratricopeptide repeat protein, partial [Fastidiosipila sp.]|nr:tetratricopeptide repeat protein [Fastidiosipila sp.]
VLRQNGDNKAVRKELERLIEHYPSESNYLLYLADFYLEMGKSDQAYSLYQEVARDYPSNGQVHFSLANYYFSLGQADIFKSSIFKAFSHPNTPFELKMQRVLPFLMGIEEEDPALTVEDLRSVISGLREMHPFDLQAHILAANFYKHINDNAAAREALQTALYIDENNQEVWQDYLILLFEEETQNQFLSESLRASTLFPDNGLFHYFAGYGFLFQEKRKEALVSFETALPFLSDNASLQAQVYGLMGDLYFQEQQAQKAFRAYEESLKLEQENVVVLNNYAYYLSELDLHLDKAERMISRVIELEGSNPTYLDTYAWVLFKRGQYLDALYFIEQAVANMEEESAVLYEHYGDILFKVGNIEKALEKWNKALELGSDVSSVLEDKIAEQKYLPEIMDYE